MSKAAGAYTNLSDGAKAILDTLYVPMGSTFANSVSALMV